nr:glycosyltransferase family 2 protein [Myxococcota bacterium]
LLGAVATGLAQRRSRARRLAIEAAGRPMVSVVVAARNAEDCIERSIRSLLAQTHRELEILFVDDASTDRTAELVHAIAAQDDRVRVLRNDRRRRAAMSRNVGLAQAKGTYVTFQDADDTSHPERIERQLAALLARPDAVLCVCNSRRETPDGARVVVNGRRFARSFISMMFPREKVLSRIGYLRALEVGEDAEYYERIRAVFGAERELHLFETLYRARFAEGSLLFSNGEVRVGPANDVEYVQSPAARRALHEAMERVAAIRGGASPFVPFVDESVIAESA